MAATPFPHQYEVALELDQLLAPPRTPVRTGAPPQFGGSSEVWSPEHLLAAAVLACVKTTFDAFARIRGLPVYGWFGRVVATLERGARGPKFTSIRVELNITTELGEETRLRETVAAVESACIVARALAVPVEIVTTVTTQPVDIAC